ncbi:hypothetical protein MYSTI_03057 [Myxococcus stipitatus DSM 14675]|uniref:DUF7481 domain-containing protein n=1 Tax=Myxococcus stipitatus (strain DSM 14675 / JCM 12634 / Mx s8) TaxID=1278073 RepID=L7U8E9_MYXSD|nr:hypothetical protein [Myxococcus stipitatus]AGC44373.1 hypothetical protein MYSTI_03057 [Myxococcus stipitatus DSM 14675]
MRRVQAGLLCAVLWGMGCETTKDADEGGPGGETPEESPLELFKSGSRIKVRGVTTSDGLRWVERLHDSQRQADCSWEKAAPDGAVYCVSHEGLFNLPGPGSRGDYYFDASCTEGLRVHFGPLPSGAVLTKHIACGELPRFHAPGERVTTTPYSLDLNTGACLPRALSSGDVAYRAGAEVSAGTLFVRGQVTQKWSGSGFTLRFVDGEDGSSSIHRIQDTARDTECSIERASDQKLRCLPSGHSTAVSFGGLRMNTNATCTEEAVGISCDTPRFATITSESRCNPTTATYAIGAEVTQVYARYGNTCERSTAVPSDWRFFSPGKELPAATWLEAQERDFKTYGRLKVRGAELGAVLQLPRELHDTQLGTACGFQPDVEGTPRCFPLTEASVTKGNAGHYADAACTRPLARTPNQPCTPPRFAHQYDDTTGPQPGNRIYALGATHAGDIYVWVQSRPDAPAECVRGERQSGTTYSVLGDEVPAKSLVAGTKRID